MRRSERIEWDGSDPEALAARLRPDASEAEVAAAVASLVERVRAGGDEALAAISAELGDPVPERLRVDPEAVAAAPALIGADVREAMRVAAANVGRVAEAQATALLRPVSVGLDAGQRVEVGASAVRSAGVYAPGGRAAYPSSVLMSAIPARAAGVRRIVVASPPTASGRPADPVLAACAIAGVDEVYAVGGAQAIAALAFGTDSIAPVDAIAGPGNPYVTEAKRQVSGRVSIDGLAGPSELVVVADGSAAAELIALDLCAQAEHGDDSPLVLIATDGALLDEVAARAAELAESRPSVADAPLHCILAPGLELALSLADAFAPEHLELVFTGADEAAARGRVAGCVFIGRNGATAFGDYVAGSNHVLPTGGAARFGGPLGPGAFLRRSSVVTIPSAAAAQLAPHTAALARAEGFPVHGESASARAVETKR